MKLNEKSIREKYKEFYGKNPEQMGLLIKDNRIPLTIKQIIERRLNSKQDHWKKNYFDTCDAIVYGEQGKFKIVKNCKLLKDMTEQTKLENGAIKISKQFYKELKRKEFSGYHDEEVWKELLEELYKPYIKMLDYTPNIYVSSSDEFCLRAWFVGRLEYRSNAFGRDDLDNWNGRLLGIASEMQEDLK